MSRLLVPMWCCDFPECAETLTQTTQAQTCTRAPSMQTAPPGWARLGAPHLKDFCADHAYVADAYKGRVSAWQEARTAVSRAHYQAGHDAMAVYSRDNPYPVFDLGEA